MSYRLIGRIGAVMTAAALAVAITVIEHVVWQIREAR